VCVCVCVIEVLVSEGSFHSVCPQHYRAARRCVVVVMTPALYTAGSNLGPATTATLFV
jgi:hypothetical protein